MFATLDNLFNNDCSTYYESLKRLQNQIGGETSIRKNKAKLSRSETKSNQGKLDIESTHIVDYLNHSSNQEIRETVIETLNSTKFCDKILGAGYVGKVKVSGIGDSYTIVYRDIDVTIPVAVKESQVDSDVFAFTNPDNQDLYLYCDRGISTEALILYYLRVLINEKRSPHLPLIIGHGKCDTSTIQPIDKIITERHGLDEELHVKLTGHYESPLWFNVPGYDPENPVYSTHLTNFDDLCVYMNLMKDTKDMITLPNDQECNVIDLLNYISISYIVTYDLLAKNNIYLMDIHPQNVFIHWLNKNSYMHDHFIGDTQYIYYKFGKKYYKIKTHGFIIKVGDVGASIVHPRSDLYLVGQGNDLHKTFPIVNKITQNTKCFDFLSTMIHTMSFDTFRKTIAFQIFSAHPYDKIFWLNVNDNLMRDMLHADKLIKFFDRYAIDEISKEDRENSSVLIIE